MELRKSPKSLARVSIDWFGSSRQLSKRYTEGTPSATRYWAKLPNVGADVVATGQELVKPDCQPFSSTTGGRVAPAGTLARGCTTTSKVVCRCSPVSPVADSVTVYS